MLLNKIISEASAALQDMLKTNKNTSGKVRRIREILNY